MSTGNDQPRDTNVLDIARKLRGHNKIEKIETYWNKVRGKRLVPSRSEIDPRGLEGVLGNAFILERITGGLARFRIAGSHLADVTGLELRQMPISALFLPGSREILSSALEAVFDEPAIVRMSITSPGGFGREPLRGELILLPLRSDLGDVDRVLGGIVFEGKIGRTPRRIEIEGQSRKSLTGFAGPLRADTPIEVNTPVPQAPQVKPTEPPSITRGHLRLVVSND